MLFTELNIIFKKLSQNRYLVENPEEIQTCIESNITHINTSLSPLNSIDDLTKEMDDNIRFELLSKIIGLSFYNKKNDVLLSGTITIITVVVTIFGSTHSVAITYIPGQAGENASKPKLMYGVISK